MAYIGREPQIGNYQVCDAISVVNGQAAYTMQVSSVNVIPESVNHMIVSLNGVIQNPGSSYTISSSTITFSSNLATGDSIDFIYLLGNVLDLGAPSDSTVTTSKLSGNLVTPGTLDVNGQELILDANANTSITADTDDQIDIKVAGADDFRITANTFTALSGSGVVIPDGGLTLGSTAVSSTAAELNLLDGGTSVGGSITVADADGFVVNDGGAMKTIPATDVKTYVGGFDVSSITGATALTAEPATTDEFVLSDNGTLKRIDFKHMSNTPAFEAVFNSQVSGVSDNTYTKAAYNVESYDTDSAYDTSAYRFTPGVAGKYYVYMNIIFDAQGVDKFHSCEVAIYKNGSIHRKAYFDQYDNYLAYAKTPYLACSVTLDDDDYVEGYLLFNVTTGTNHLINTGGVFGAFRLIGH